MSNKNPFEIRAEVLQLAKDYMDQQYRMNITFAEKMFEQGIMAQDEFAKAFTMYSTEDLMKKAHEMYSFVSKKE